MRHPNGAKLSDRQIAEHVGVTAPMVGKYREELSATAKDLQSDQRTGRDGRTIDTTNIGSAATAPDPKTQPKEYARFASHDGASLRDIAKATGKSHEAVRKWLQPPKVDSKLTDGASPGDQPDPLDADYDEEAVFGLDCQKGSRSFAPNAMRAGKWCSDTPEIDHAYRTADPGQCSTRTPGHHETLVRASQGPSRPLAVWAGFPGWRVAHARGEDREYLVHQLTHKF